MTNKTVKRIIEKPFNFYGIRETRNKKYMSVTLVRSDENGKKEWLNVPINVKYTTIGDNYCLIKLKLLTAGKVKKEADKSKKYDDDLPF